MPEINSIFSWFLIISCLLLIAKILWKRRWLYYYSWLLPGPFSLPLIGSPVLLSAGQKGAVEMGLKLFETYPSVFRVWTGPQMFIITSKVNDVEYILANSLHKENILVYTFLDDVFTSIFTTSLHKWQPRRKNLNRSFNQKVLNSYFDVQVKLGNRMAKKLELHCGKTKDLLPEIWTTTLDVIFETIGAVDVTTLPEKNSRFIPMLISYEESFIERTLNPLYYLNWIWKLSSKYKDLRISKEMYIRQIRETIPQKNSPLRSDLAEENDFISRAVKDDYPTTELEEEIAFLFLAGSETSAIIIGSVLLALSIHPEVQTKLYEEVKTLLADDNELTLEDLSKLDYLERVIKEAMRLLPPVPIVARYIDKTVEIDGQVYPEGCGVVVPIRLIHRKPEYWSDPLKFDPDRFLPEEVKKRPRCAYLPFSFGPRNCIGIKYGMMSTKILLAKIIKNFEVLPGEYKSFAEIETVFHLNVNHIIIIINNHNNSGNT